MSGAVYLVGDGCPHCGLVVVTAKPFQGAHRLCSNCRHITGKEKMLVATNQNSYRNPETGDWWVKPEVIDSAKEA